MAEETRLEISRVDDTDDPRWLVTLFDHDDDPRLQSTTPLDRGEVLDVAKVLKYEAAKAPVSIGEQEPGYTGWTLEFDKAWLIKFTSISATQFSFSDFKLETLPDDNTAKDAMSQIQDALQLADIQWNPPEDNPAIPYADIETPTKGHPGS